MSQSDILNFADWRQRLYNLRQERLLNEDKLLMTEREIRDLGYREDVAKSIFDFVN